MQIPSRTTIRLINDSLDSVNCPYSAEILEPMKEVFLAVDRLVDIMNATSKDDNSFDSCERIKHPRHAHIQELLTILSLFFSGKKNPVVSKRYFYPMNAMKI